MINLWHRLSLSLRLFISFGIFTVLVSFGSIWMQAEFFIKARVENMTQAEIPNRLRKIKAEISLVFAPSLQLARVLANDPGLPELLAEAETNSVDTDAKIAEKLKNFYQDMGVDTLALSPSPNLGTTYYQYRDGTLLQRPMHKGDPDDAWYAGFVASGLLTRAEFDTNSLSGTRRMLFINARSRAEDGTGNPKIVSSVALDARAVTEIIDQFRIGKRGLISLVSAKGDIDMAAEHSILTALKTAPGFEQLLDTNQDRVIELTQAETGPYFLASIWIDKLNRFLIIEVPKDQLIKPIQQQTFAALALSLVLLGIALLLLYPLTRSMTRPLRRAQTTLNSISRTLDLSKRLEVTDQAEVGQLAAQINALLKRLASVIHAISSSSGRLDQSATLLAHTAGLTQSLGLQQDQSMASAIEQMSASVAEITSTMEEFSASSTQIAEKSESVVELAKETHASSQRGAQVMLELEQQMLAIQSVHSHSLGDILALGEQSREIGKVMELINNLAEQTRLIAFNAALEASSAGEAGRRFSVVASEIRRLANTVSSSTKSIEERIQAIQETINRLIITSEKSARSVAIGMEMSSTTATELDNLIDAAGLTTDAALQISLSTKQQKTASSQVTIALRTIANASTSNAKSMRSISQISEDMLALAAELKKLLSELSLKEQAAERPDSSLQ